MAQQTSQPSQKLVSIEEIRNGIVILKNGALRQILMVSGVNFDLKSEEEQGLILYGYQNLLNALDFSIQFFIHSRKINIEGYLEKLTGREEQETNDLLKNQVREYREFIRSFVTENPIMQKSFFVVIPYDPIQVPEAALKVGRGLFSIFRKKTPISTGQEKEQQLEKGLTQLSQRLEQVINGLSAIGLTAVALDTNSVTELFYNLYNPEAIEKVMRQTTSDK
ncbi:MAG: hypothetical protein AAB885_02025 [Patescibacteria group bacterium]